MFRKITLALNFLYLAPANLLLVYMIFLWFFPSVPILFILLVLTIALLLFLTIALSTLLLLHILKDKKNKVWIIILNSLMLIFSLGWFGVIVERIQYSQVLIILMKILMKNQSLSSSFCCCPHLFATLFM